MSEMILLCFLQGVEKEFSVCVDETEIETIKDFRELVKFRKKRFILQNKIDIDKFEIWKVSVPLSDGTSSDNIRKKPAEIKNGVKLDDQQEIRGLWKKYQYDRIQVFMGDSVKITPSPEDEIKELKTLIRDLSEQITNLINLKPTSKTRSLHTLSDLCVMGIRVDDELYSKIIIKNYCILLVCLRSDILPMIVQIASGLLRL